MFCKNCRQNIGNRNDCPYCGYDPTLDTESASPRMLMNYVEPRPVQITLNKLANGNAIAALILSFFGLSILPGIISFFLALGGFFQAKKCRTGRIMSIIALLIDAFWLSLYVLAILSSTNMLDSFIK